jgi:hypothetical protein
MSAPGQAPCQPEGEGGHQDLGTPRSKTAPQPNSRDAKTLTIFPEPDREPHRWPAP